MMGGLPALLSLLLLAAPAWAAPQAPNTWQEIPNTKYTASSAICGNAGALPAPNCVPTTFGGQNAIDAWVDGDYAPSLKMLIVPRGGGHGDGQGNQVAGFQPDLPGWVLLTPPSLNAPPITATLNEPRAIYPDGTPSSVHSYGALAWMEWLKRLWSAGGIYWSQAGESFPQRTWWWDPTHAETPTSAWSLRYERPCGYGTYAVADPLRRRILMRCYGGMYSYTPAAPDGTVLDTVPTINWQTKIVAGYGPNPYRLLYSQTSVSNSARALDPVAQLVYSISAQSGGGLAVQRGNVTPGLTAAQAREITLLTTGGPTSTYGMGLIWDAGRLVTLGPAPVAGKATLWTLDPTNCGTGTLPPCPWIQHLSPNGVYSEGVDTAHGTWRKFFRYACDFYHVAGGAKNVWKVTPPWQTNTCGPVPPR